jgi:N-acyl-D-aspartate/D-glutamate deacylase
MSSLSRVRVLILACAAVLVGAALPGRGAAAPVYDLVITGGRVIDPATNSDRIANVAIRAGRIAEVGSRLFTGKQSIDARGLVVAPGFIDILSGENPVGDAFKAADGVTTVLSTHGGPVDVASWYEEVRKRGALVNYGTVVGHGSLRVAAGAIDGKTPATPEQAARMSALAEQAMEQGALGVGFGIEYLPGTSGEEIVALARVAARHSASLHAHIRLPHVLDPFQGINELIAASAVTGARVQVVHIGSMCIHRQKEALALIDAARERGIDIAADVYPYDAWMTRIETAIFDPGWQEKYALDYKDLVWAATGERLTPETFASYRKQGGFVVCHQIPEEEIILALRHPAVSIASDGTIGEGPANHPRSAGTFARVLARYVREQKALTLMAALRKMTLMPAQRMEKRASVMRRKGRLSPGMDADVTLFDPEKVEDRATYQEPKRASAGIPYVLVNGALVVREGRVVGDVQPGQPVRGDAPVRRTAGSPR